MIRHYGRNAARAREQRGRREIARESGDWRLKSRERLTGRCALCGRAHGLPDARVECSVCGREACFGGCGCEEGTG